MASQIPGQGGSMNVKYQMIKLLTRKMIKRNEWHLQFGFLLAIFGVINKLVRLTNNSPKPLKENQILIEHYKEGMQIDK